MLSRGLPAWTLPRFSNPWLVAALSVQPGKVPYWDLTWEPARLANRNQILAVMIDRRPIHPVSFMDRARCPD